MESRKNTHFNVDDKKVYDQELIYARMLGLMSSSREINIDDCLATKLTPYPGSMFDATGMMRMATKSTLKNDLRVNVSGRSFGNLPLLFMTFQLCCGQYLDHQMQVIWVISL